MNVSRFRSIRKNERIQCILCGTPSYLLGKLFTSDKSSPANGDGNSNGMEVPTIQIGTLIQYIPSYGLSPCD